MFLAFIQQGEQIKMKNFKIALQKIKSIPTLRFTINAEDLLYCNPTLDLTLIKTITFTCLCTEAPEELKVYSDKSLDVYVSINNIHYILDYYFSAPLENIDTYSLQTFAIQEVKNGLGSSLLEQILYKLRDRNIEKQRQHII